jgi:hypothetical protein
MAIDFVAVHCGGNLPSQQCGADVQMVFQHQEIKAV